MKTVVRAEEVELIELCKAVFECHNQAPHDFSGDFRTFYLPRLFSAVKILMRIMPNQMYEATTQAVDGWGDKVVKE